MVHLTDVVRDQPRSELSTAGGTGLINVRGRRQLGRWLWNGIAIPAAALLLANGEQRVVHRSRIARSKWPANVLATRHAQQGDQENPVHLLSFLRYGRQRVPNPCLCSLLSTMMPFLAHCYGKIQWSDQENVSLGGTVGVAVTIDPFFGDPGDGAYNR
jgi:hypothetical protein